MFGSVTGSELGLFYSSNIEEFTIGLLKVYKYRAPRVRVLLGAFMIRDLEVYIRSKAVVVGIFITKNKSPALVGDEGEKRAAITNFSIHSLQKSIYHLSSRQDHYRIQ